VAYNPDRGFVTNAEASPGKVKALCVATRCATVDELVATFHRFCDDEAFFVATLATRPVGLETPFAVLLADRTPAIRGLCTVTDAWTTPLNPYRRPGIRLKIVKLTRDSTDVYARLRERRADEREPIPAVPLKPPRFEVAGSTPRPFEDDRRSLDDDRDAYVLPRTTTRPMTPPITPEVAPVASGEIEDRTEPARAPEPAVVVETTLAAGAARASGLPTLPRPGAKPAPVEKASVAPRTAAAAPVVVVPRTISRPVAPARRPSEPRPPVLALESSPRRARAESEITEVTPPPANPPERSVPLVSEVTSPATTDIRRADEPVSTASSELATPPVDAHHEPAAPEERAVGAELASPPEPVTATPPEHATATGEVSAAAPTAVASTMSAATLPESRTPGSEFILPANPLMNLSDESLEGFVDCTLYEVTAVFATDELTPLPGPRPMPLLELQEPAPVAPYSAYPPTSDAPEVSHAASVPDVPSHAETSASADPPSSAPSLAPLVPDAPAYAAHSSAEDAPAASSALYSPAPPGELAPHTVHSESAATHPHPSPASPADSAMQYPGYPVGSWHAPQTALPFAAATVQPALGHVPATPRPRRRWPIVAGVCTSVVVIAVAIVMAQSSSAPARESDPAVTAELPVTRQEVVQSVEQAVSEPPAVKPSAPPPAEPAVTVVPAPAGDAEATIAADGLRVVGRGPCRVVVVATPAGARVQIDDKDVGTAPLAHDGPCERRRVEVSSARYAPATRWATPTTDRPETLDVTLVRPTHALTVTTIPPGATISIDGRRAGTSPVVVQVTGFQAVRITADKPGYRSVTRRVYTKRAKDRVILTMPSTLFLKAKPRR
jgi:hypothetical protein